MTPFPRSLPRWSRRLLLGSAFWIAVLVMVVPTVSFVGFSASLVSPASPSTHASAHAPAVAVAPVKHASAPNAALPGANTKGQKFYVNPGLNVRQAANQSRFASITNISNLPGSPGAMTSSSVIPGPVPAAAPLVRPNVYIPTGAFYGYVYDRETLKPLQGATIQAYGAAGQDCPATTCEPVQSIANGSFTVFGPVGFDYVQASLAYHLDNITYASAGNGTRTNVGTIYLVETAIVRGIVKSDTPPSDVAISGVQVSDSSPIAGIVADPGASTASNGSFQVAALDSPSELSFTPPAGVYESNFTWMNATPGQLINLGTIYLERLTFVKINVTDSVTGGALEAGTIGSVQLCSLANGCGGTQQGVTVATRNGPSHVTTLSAFGAPGASYAMIEVTGYILAEPTVGTIPREPPGHVFWLPPVNITPTGTFQFNVGMYGNDLQNGVGAVPHTGLWTVTVCTMDGFDQIGTIINQRTGLPNTTQSSCVGGGCLSVDTQNVQIAAAPLRNSIFIDPDYRPTCSPFGPTWPIPGDTPVWFNETYFNITPDEVTNFGWLNFTVGTYVNGNVTVDGLSTAPSEFAVTISSLNYPSLTTTYAYSSTFSPFETYACGAQITAAEFCAPAPPGPDLVTVTANGYPNNYTWVSVPEAYVGVPAGVALGDPANLQETTVNVTASGFITGNVTEAGTNFGLALASVDICSVSPTYPVGCSSGASNLRGVFDFPAPLGWDYVKISASQYQPDYVWAYVNASQQVVTVGNIGLQPLAIVQGRVVDPDGNPVLGATAVACPLTQTSSTCPALGAGRVGTDGFYLGEVVGGWLPIATYKVVVSAAGYSTNWAWVNATIGNITNVSTLVLYPSGSNGTSGGGGSNGTNTTNATQISTWLVGEFFDNVTKIGVQTGSYLVCPVDGSPCSTPNGGTNTGGFFNVTIPAGLYYLNISAPGYQFLSVYFNSSGAAYLNLGTIDLAPLPWLFGNVTVNPWNRIYVGSAYSFTLGPLAIVRVCTVNGVCAPTNGPTSSVDPTGQFEVWGEPGANDIVTVTPAAPAGFTSPNGGFVQNKTTANISLAAITASVNQTIYLDIYASVSFTIWNNLSWVTTGGQVTPLPVRYAGATVTATGVNTATVAYFANGGGQVTFFLPPGNPAKRVFYAATVGGAWETGTGVVSVMLEAGGSYNATNLSLLHYGWETGFVVETNTYQPAVYLGVSSSSTPAGSTLTYSSNSDTNGGGFFNISAAASPFVKFTVGPGNDFNSTVFLDSVNLSNSSSVRSLDITHPGNVTLDHWGYVSSTQVNYSQFPPATGAIDVVKGLPVWDVGVFATSQNGIQTSGTNLPETNDNGQFLVDAPPGPGWVNYSRPLYETNSTHLKVTAGEDLPVSRVNLTGDGVVAALVLSKPGNIPVAGANITDCLAGQRLCGFTQTNGTGIFWVNATPGLNFINVTANGFIPASPTLVNVCSDCFVHVTPIPVYQPAYISGKVLGLPAGFPIRLANVSACSPTGGTPTGPCLYTVQTTVSGSFLLIVPAGNYILSFSDPNFNSTYLAVSVSAGERVQVGTVFLQAFGAVTGAVYDNSTIRPVEGAAVFACPVWSGGVCVSGATDVGGHYLLEAAPGPYVVTISAAGYSDLEQNVVIVGGRTTVAPTAFLIRLGTDTPYTVSGTVIADGAPFANALVAATYGGVVAASTVTNVSGGFQFQVLYGTYVLTASAQGESPASIPIVVHGPLSGLRITLSVQTYTETGRIVDGLTNLPLASVQILVGTTVANTTGLDGKYAVALPNGTSVLTAVYQGSSAVNYGQVSFAVQINGGGGVRNISLYPPITDVFGLVVDGASGTPLAGAGVLIVGRATDAKVINETLQTSPSGAFQVNLPEGTYSVTGIYGGYANTTLTVTPRGVSTQLLVPLTSTSTVGAHAAGSSGNAWLGVGVALGAIVVLGAAAAIVSLYRSGRLGHRRPPAKGASP
ncbi:MAG: carboxypeptidase regulatory-like domain-containing protein [Thermoplasmata archaeon]|nr:carboxypeptidase regulatory-like domain-containing protein [Thermoplasmata archaeon]